MLQIRNYMEGFVLDVVDDVIKNLDMCNCDRCKMDVAAKALNELPPQYVVSQKGEVFSEFNLRSQFQVQVISAVSEAAMLVKARPHHDK